MTTAPGRPGRARRGLSLVELMVGMTVGLFVVGAASLLVAAQLGDSRRLLLETQLQQDLRAAADIITRELRRAGAHGDPAALLADAPSEAAPNAYASVQLASDGQEIQIDYHRAGQTGMHGFKRDGGLLRSRLGDAWQPLTDENTMRVTAFSIRPLALASFTVPCPRACSGADPSSCWPTLEVRSYQIDIEAESVADANVRRSLRGVVRMRNDALRFNDLDQPNRACPP